MGLRTDNSNCSSPESLQGTRLSNRLEPRRASLSTVEVQTCFFLKSDGCSLSNAVWRLILTSFERKIFGCVYRFPCAKSRKYIGLCSVSFSQEACRTANINFKLTIIFIMYDKLCYCVQEIYSEVYRRVKKF